MKTKICIYLFLIARLPVVAQHSAIDSLRTLLAREQPDTVKTRLLIQMGNIYQSVNDSALMYYRDALELAGKTGSKKDEILARSNMADYLRLRNDNATALELYLQNIELAKQTGDTQRIFIDTRDVGFLYGRIGDYQQEYEYVKKLQALFDTGIFKDSDNNKAYQRIVFNRLAAVYNHLNKPDSAIRYGRVILDYGRTINEAGWVALGASRLGDAYDLMNNVDSSFHYYRLCLAASGKANRKDLYYSAMHNLGKLFWQRRQADSAIAYSKKSFNGAEKILFQSSSPQMDAAGLLAEIYEKLRQPDSAYKYLRAYVKIRDSLFNNQKLARLQNVALRQSLQAMQLEQERREAVREYQARVRLFFLLAGLGVTILLAFIFYRSGRQQKIASRKIEKAYTELQTTQAQLIQSEKMASLGQLTAGIAHEIQNPLNFVNNFSEINTELIAELKEEIEKGDLEEAKAIANDIKENEQKIIHHGKRADSIVKGMLQHSRASSGKKELTNINALVDESLRLSYHGMRAKDKDFNATINTDFDESIGKINIIPQDISRVLLNLLNNAFYAVDEKKRQLNRTYEPTVIVCTKKDNDKVLITVKDNGNGIPQNIVDKIFQPFFTTKPTGQGTGLGLSLSYDIIKAHGGEIKLETKEGEGTSFIINIPLK